MRLRLAPASQLLLSSIAGDTPHAMLLTGPTGIGLKTLATHIAKTEGRLLVNVTPESKSTAVASINVERIRRLYDETKSKLDSAHFVIIDDADSMNVSAQNALLKLLEEPNESIRFILTSHRPDALLPTIRSRVRHFAVPPISAVESKRLLSRLGVSSGLDEQRLLFVAQGLPAELCRLATNKSDFTLLTERVQQARQLVEGTAYQRLAVALSFSGDRQEALRFIEMVILLLRRSLERSPDLSTIERIDSMAEASESIRSNGNVKLQLASAVLQ